jgi:hypothetical protein
LAPLPVNLDHFPAATLGNLAEFADLVLDRLMVCADPHIQRGSFHLLNYWNSRNRQII